MCKIKKKSKNRKWRTPKIIKLLFVFVLFCSFTAFVPEMEKPISTTVREIIIKIRMYNKDVVTTKALQSAPGWSLLLVNDQNPLPEDYNITLKDVAAGQRVDARIAQNLTDMIAAAKADGVSLIICSAYRNEDLQAHLFSSSGYSRYDNSKYVAVPGHSEHHTGLAVDIVTDNYRQLDKYFETTKAAYWLSKNAANYGFVMRYPEGKEEITGIAYEPWHYRFVGVEHAQIMRRKSLCLEEYLLLIAEDRSGVKIEKQA